MRKVLAEEALGGADLVLERSGLEGGGALPLPVGGGGRRRRLGAACGRGAAGLAAVRHGRNPRAEEEEGVVACAWRAG